ncbi:argininosuccinate synthase [Lentzea rhizosphaerae]|uniref:Argininosuccinate synthase n=1 Tax=Lentzea rhizosphaerae TaxID=2041025 RepID=A0ABV8BYP4_9PSEU
MNDPVHAVLTFDAGVPVAVDGETVSVAEAVRELNFRAGVVKSNLGSVAVRVARMALATGSGEVDVALHEGRVVGLVARSEESLYDFAS